MRYSLLVFALAALPVWGADELFEERVRPLLSARCLGCHGERAASGLRLDSREGMLRGGKRGAAIVPGDPARSLVLQAVKHGHADLKMPPDGKLGDTEIAYLERWVRDGAVWPSVAPVRSSGKWWAFADLGKAEGSIDTHVREGLRKQKIAANSRADDRTLLIRLFVDLTGVRPGAEESREFLEDRRADKVERLVDRLLESKAFGERWGRHWLDVARYGESDFSGTAPRPYPQAWRYRDWVIEAFNKDMPYDRFVRAQIAGDLQDGDTRELIGGLGLFGFGPWYYGISQPPQARADERHDRVDMVTRGFLGLTAACARCHDHKYDPIPQADYYALAGVFASSEYKKYPLASEEEVKAYEAAQGRIKKIEKEIEDFLRRQQEELAGIYARQSAAYLLNEGELDAGLMERWKKYLSKTEEDHPYLNSFLEAKSPEEKRAGAKAFQEALVGVLARKKEIDEDNRKALIREGGLDAKRRKVILPFDYDSEGDFNPGAFVPTMALERADFQLWHKLVGDKAAVLRLEGVDLEKRLLGEWAKHLSNLRAELEQEKKRAPAEYAYLQGLAEHAEPLDLGVDVRGNPFQPGQTEPRHFLRCLSGGTPAVWSRGSGRKELAEAVVNHPLAARVMANRVWGWLMGAGVVRTPSNFGLMGERPANPELLNYLAAHFQANAFSVKKLVREIVLSATYQASSATNPAAEAVDGENRLFWRANRKRLDWESMRDSMLASSGELDRTYGGPSAELNENNLRRTVYASVGRYQQDETMALFDFPSASVHAEQRAVTNVPPQKLFFLNSSFVMARANALAKRAENLEDFYWIVYGRGPAKAEKNRAEEFLKNGSREGLAQALLSGNEFLYVD